MLEIREASAYAECFAALRDRTAQARIDIRIRRLSLGNPGDVRSVGRACPSCKSIATLAIEPILQSKAIPSSSFLQVGTSALKIKRFVSPRTLLAISRRLQ
jgi:hypothetical protein